MTGSVEGSVEDQTGGVLPNAKVTISRPETNLTRVLMTDNSGLFRADLLPLGTYKITAELTGFAAANTTVEVSAGSPLTLKLVLKTGSRRSRSRSPARRLRWISATSTSAVARPTTPSRSCRCWTATW